MLQVNSLKAYLDREIQHLTKNGFAQMKLVVRNQWIYGCVMGKEREKVTNSFLFLTI